jgi:methylglutaconyl-CoA hydratase
MPDYRHLITRREGPVEHLFLNRPEVRNAFNDELIAELSAWAAAISTDESVRVVVLGGMGQSFCAGADVAWMANTIAYTEEQNVRDATDASWMFAALNNLPIPVVGRIHGAALGGGAGLVAICDVAVAEDNAVFGFSEVKLGVVPAVISPFVLEKVGRSAARELFLTGRRFTAARAHEMGLVHAVVPSRALDKTIREYTAELLTGGREAIASAKSLIENVWGEPLASAMPVTARTIAQRRVSAEGQEGLRAFLEKRKPRWSLS